MNRGVEGKEMSPHVVKGKSNKISTCALCIRCDEESTRVQLQEPSAQDVLP